MQFVEPQFADMEPPQNEDLPRSGDHVQRVLNAAAALGTEPERPRWTSAMIVTCRVIFDSPVGWRFWRLGTLPAKNAGSNVRDTVARFDRLDVLVNDAGFGIFARFADSTTADWRRQLTTDLDGAFFGARASLPHLLKMKGSIVNVSSASGLGGDWDDLARAISQQKITTPTKGCIICLRNENIHIGD